MAAMGVASATNGQEIVSGAGFSIAVRALLPVLRGYAQRLTRDPAVSDDLVQDALTSAWRARGRFEPGTNFKAWLFRILRNRFLSTRRRAWREIGWDPDLHERRLAGAADQESGLMLEDLQRALTRLPAGHADALRLVVHDGLSYEDAAERLGVPRGTVSSQVQRARAALLDDLAGVAKLAKAELRQPEPAPASGALYARWKQSGSRTIG